MVYKQQRVDAERVVQVFLKTILLKGRFGLLTTAPRRDKSWFYDPMPRAIKTARSGRTSDNPSSRCTKYRSRVMLCGSISGD